MIATIVSSATPGAELGALDAAIELDLQYGGWRSADDEVPAIYGARMRATPSHRGMARRLNVQDSDGTLIVSFAPELAGAARFVDAAVEGQGKPGLHVCLPVGGNSQVPDGLARQVREWIVDELISVLNVAGPTEEDEPGIQEATRDLLVWILEDE